MLWRFEINSLRLRLWWCLVLVGIEHAWSPFPKPDRGVWLTISKSFEYWKYQNSKMPSTNACFPMNPPFVGYVWFFSLGVGFQVQSLDPPVLWDSKWKFITWSTKVVAGNVCMGVYMIRSRIDSTWIWPILILLFSCIFMLQSKILA